MAGFKTHITASTLVGIGYGSAGYALGLPLSTSILAGGLCSVSGMLPDLDSDSGVPLRETVTFAAAVVPMLMLDRFHHMGLSNEEMVLAAALVYVAIRFGIAEIFRHYTVHRGMWHSLPAAATVGLVAWMVCCGQDPVLRSFKSMAVVLGFVIHLLLDELWSIDLRRGRIRLKKSFGTALKLWGGNTWANVSTYGKLLLLLVLVFKGDRMFMEYFADQEHKFHRTARQVIHQVLEPGETIQR